MCTLGLLEGAVFLPPYNIAFGVGSAEDVRRGAERLDACGIPNSGVKPGVLPGATLVVFRDPDNIQLEYYHLPGDRAP